MIGSAAIYYSSLDLHFAKAMLSLCPPKWQSPAGALLCRLLSFHIRSGHVCLDQKELASLKLWPLLDSKKHKISGIKPLKASEEKKLLLSQESLNWLNTSPIVTREPEDKICPLVWKKPRLYLYRYYAYERELRQRLLSFSCASERVEQASQIQKALRSLYSSNEFSGAPSSVSADKQNKDVNKVDLQKLAILLSCLRPFLIISGGPGTGKTSTLARILHMHFKLNANLRIALAAPTGKATMRIQEALDSYKSFISTSIIGTPALKISTLQRLLGQSHDGLSFRYNEKRRLALDLLVIDEASMLDLALLVRTLVALAPEARLILLGDHRQLASVESGAVLGELCRLPANLSPTFAKKLEALFMGVSLHSLVASKKNLLTNNMIILEKNFRFEDKSGIALASKHIRNGDSTAFLRCLESKEHADIHYCAEGLDSPKFEESIIRGFSPMFAKKDPESILKKLADFCVLSPFREGREGTRALNIYIGNLLTKNRLINTEKGRLEFCPILICQNDYDLDLFNGDLGLLYQTKGKSLAYFFPHILGTSETPKREKSLREIPIELLPAYEMGFAMTVHRSQGSEFNHVSLVIPFEEHPLLSREIVYTALTRARQEISIFASSKSLKGALSNPTKRNSALLLTSLKEEKCHHNSKAL